MPLTLTQAEVDAFNKRRLAFAGFDKERFLAIVKARAAGETQAAIGLRCGMSRCRVGQLLQQFEREQRIGLSRRATNILVNAGIVCRSELRTVTKVDVIARIRLFGLERLWKARNCGATTMTEFMSFIGMDTRRPPVRRRRSRRDLSATPDPACDVGDSKCL